jgi:hypothetical protein
LVEGLLASLLAPHELSPAVCGGCPMAVGDYYGDYFLALGPNKLTIVAQKVKPYSLYWLINGWKVN